MILFQTVGDASRK